MYEPIKTRFSYFCTSLGILAFSAPNSQHSNMFLQGKHQAGKDEPYDLCLVTWSAQFSKPSKRLGNPLLTRSLTVPNYRPCLPCLGLSLLCVGTARAVLVVSLWVYSFFSSNLPTSSSCQCVIFFNSFKCLAIYVMSLMLHV